MKRKPVLMTELKDVCIPAMERACLDFSSSLSLKLFFKPLISTSSIPLRIYSPFQMDWKNDSEQTLPIF